MSGLGIMLIEKYHVNYFSVGGRVSGLDSRQPEFESFIIRL